jgi:membrane protein DedA with SNARE-associated domain
MESLLTTVHVWGYPAIFVGGFIEGLNVTLISSFFIAHGVFSVIPVFIASATGNFLSDLMWYSMGKKYGERGIDTATRYIPFFRVINGKRSVQNLRTYLTNKKGFMLCVTKFAIGSGIATQIIAGVIDMPRSEFMRLSALANALFTAVVIAIGYTFGESYLAALHFSLDVGIAITLVILALVIIEYIGSRYSRYILSKNGNGA